MTTVVMTKRKSATTMPMTVTLRKPVRIGFHNKVSIKKTLTLEPRQ